MAELDVNKTTTTALDSGVDKVTISSAQLDAQGAKEISYTFPDANQNLDYYQSIPELQSALNVLSFRVAGLGYKAEDFYLKQLEDLTGWGEDSIDLIFRMLVIEKKVFGDAFAEIVRNDNGTLINLKKLYAGDMKIVLDKQGRIDYYEQMSNVPGGKPKKFKTHEILHLCNNRIANEIHGTSIIPVLKKIIDAKNEALTDERKIRHRELALGVMYVDEDDTAKLNHIKEQYKDAVNNGEVLVLPSDTAKLGDNPQTPRDRIQWLQYLDNLFYQVVGIPKVLVTSEGFTEAGGKAGLLAFEPVELAEKRELEQDIWNQLAIRIKFIRSPSLLGEAVGTEKKNAGQTGVQQNETEVRPTRTE